MHDDDGDNGDESADDGHDDSAASDALGPGVEQFQRAALDAVRAMRGLLDAAESVLADPAALESVVQSVASLARTAGEAVVGFAAGRAPTAPGGAATSDDPTSDDATSDDATSDDDSDGGFQRIRVD